MPGYGESYSRAVNELVGVGRIQDRLARAVGKLVLGHSCYEPDLRAMHEALCERFSRVQPVGDEGKFAATCRELSESEAVRLAELIVDALIAVRQNSPSIARSVVERLD